jgi:hypothetical protein
MRTYNLGFMADQPSASTQPESIVPAPRRPYTTPVLRVFGTVAAITASASASGMTKDGGPNNAKT